MRRRRPAIRSASSQLTDESGQPIAFATPGAPTVDERRRCALAVQRATAPAPLPPELQAEVAAALRRRRELLADLGVYIGD